MRSQLHYRVVAPSMAVSVFLLAIGALSGWYVHRQQRQASRLLTESVGRIRAAEQMVSATREVRFHLSQFAISGEQQHLDAIPSILQTMQVSLSRAKSLPQPDHEADLLRRVQRGLARLKRDLDVLDESSVADACVRAQKISREVVIELILAPGERYLEASDAAIVQSARRSQAMAGRVALSLLLLGVCGSVAGFVVGFAAERGVRRSLLQLHVPIRSATGRLEEVIGPIDVAEPGGAEDLDSVLTSLAERIGVVVDRLRQSQLELLRSDQLAALGQLAAGLAHEIRNPLMSMKILVQSAAEAGNSAKLESRDLAVLEEELSRLEGFVQRFLDFARPPKLETRLFDIRTVVEQTVDLVSSRAARQHVLIQSRLPDGRVEIRADREQVRQVLLNAVLNSLDAVPDGGSIRIELATDGPEARDEDREETDGRRWVAIKVADNGPGIPEELGERVFDPFFSTKETGLGLGLAICRRIVEAHGGKMTAANADGGGAEVRIRLPSQTPAEAPPGD